MKHRDKMEELTRKLEALQKDYEQIRRTPRRKTHHPNRRANVLKP